MYKGIDIKIFTNIANDNKKIITVEEKSERPINIKIGKKVNIDRLSVAKFDILVFSFCGQYLAIKHQLYPTTLWIWNIIEDYLDYLLLENNITCRYLVHFHFKNIVHIIMNLFS